jgi:cysteinyl-tRNA synthetase
MTNKPSDSRPFGKSVISKTVMAITDEMKREILRCSLHSELYTSPAKYVLGVANLSKETAEQVKRLFKTNEIFVAERDENGQIPQIGQLNAQSMTAHTEIMQNLAKRMSAEASIPLNSLGIIHDNPSSAEALKASMEDLIQKCEKLNRTNSKTLKNIARLTLAVNTLQPVDNITEDVDVCFKNPATVSMAAVADAMTKQANVIP